MSEPLQKIIASRYGGRDLPVILVLPDGGRVPLSSAAETEIIVRTQAALRALASPELGRLARAYVKNEIDFTGGARRALDIAEAMVGSIAHGRDSLRLRWRTFLHQVRGNRTHAARALGLQRTYLLRLMRDLGVAAPPPPERRRVSV